MAIRERCNSAHESRFDIPMTYTTARSTCILALVLCTGASAPAGGRATVELRVQHRASAYPSIASAGSLVAVAWGASASDGTTDVYAALSRDNGRTFARSIRVSDRSSLARLAGEQPPRIVLIPQTSREPSIVVVWTAKGEAGTRLLSARSDDGGRTFSPGALVPGSDAAGNRGWESAAADPAGGVAALWLDHRELASTGGAAHAHSEHQHVPRDTSIDGAVRAQSSKLFFARLGDATVRDRSPVVCVTAARRRWLSIPTAAYTPHGGTCSREISVTSPLRCRPTADARSSRRSG